MVSGSDERAIVRSLCDGVLEQVERARSSAKLNRGFGNLQKVWRVGRILFGTLCVFLFGMLMLTARVGALVAAVISAAGAALLGGAALLPTFRRRKPGYRLSEASEELQSQLNVAASQLDSFRSQYAEWGVQVPLFDASSIDRFERDVRSLRQQIAALGR